MLLKTDTITHICTEKDWLEWTSRIKNEQTLINPQFLINWFPAFTINSALSYNVFLAYDANKTVSGILPFCLYSGRAGKIIYASPFFAYGGPWSTSDIVIKQLLENLFQYAKEQEVFVVTLSTSPFMPKKHVVETIKAFQPTYTLPNFYQYSFLDKHPTERLKSKRHSAVIKSINTSIKSDLLIRRAQSQSDIETWISIYSESLKNIGATPFPAEFLLNMLKGEYNKSYYDLSLVIFESEIIGGNLYLKGEQIVDYYCSAFKEGFRQLQPNTFLLNQAFETFIDEGYAYFNWQSSPGKSGVYQYKKNWGASIGYHYYLTRVMGDISPFTSMTIEEVRYEYPFMFVLPYKVWERS